MSIFEIKHSQADEFEIKSQKMFDGWENNGKIYAASYILVLDLNVYGEKKKRTTMFLIILWLLDFWT